MKVLPGILSIAALLLALQGCGITAPHSNAGYADIDGLSWRDVDTVMTLSFGPAALGLAAFAVDDDPATQALLEGLQGVRVKIYEIEGDPEKVASDLTHMSMNLREDGWEPVVRVVEDGEATHVLLRMQGDEIAGLTVLTSDSLEAVLVNVMGNLHPELFEEAMVALEIPAATMATESI